MNHHPLRRARLGKLVIATGLVIALLNACSSKPPGCADAETVNLARTIILDRWKAVALSYMSSFNMTEQEVARYNDGLKLEIHDIVSDGYNADAKRHSCTGVFAFTTVNGQTLSASRSFTSQATAEGGGKFVVQVTGGESLVAGLMGDFNAFNAYLIGQKKK